MKNILTQDSIPRPGAAPPDAGTVLKHTRRALVLLGASWRLEAGRRRIDVGIKDFASQEHKDILRFLFYKLLNEFEDRFVIRLHGIPFCFLPNGWDHVVYERKRGRTYSRIALCETCRLKAACPGIAAPRARASRDPNLLSFLCPVPDQPNEIVIEVNTACNLRCRACFASKKASPAALAKREIKKTIDASRRLGIMNIRLTGGEPLLRPDLPELLKYAKEKDLYVLLNTNATVLPEKMFDALCRYVDNILISLQGHDAASEERLTRGAHLFEKKIVHIRRLVEAGIPVLRCGTVISRTLLKDLDAYARLIADLGLRYWELFRPMTIRRGRAGDKEYDVAPKDISRLVGRLWSLRRRDLIATVANPVPFCSIAGKMKKDLILTGAYFDDGHSRLVRDTRGVFKPSYFIDVACGKEIAEAWQHPYRRTLCGFAYLPPACRRCRDLLRCRGGSRFWAKQAYKTFFAKDPWMRP